MDRGWQRREDKANSGVERISSREWREKQREVQIPNLRWTESYQRLDVNVLLTLITFKFMDMKI